MNQKMAQFYARVIQEEARIVHLVTNGDPSVSHQPPAITTVDPLTREVKKIVEAVYLTSLENWDRNTTGSAVDAVHGVVRVVPSVSIAPVRLAATRIAESTHRLSTAEEVANEKQRQQDNRAFYALEDNKRNQTFHVKLPEPPAIAGAK